MFTRNDIEKYFNAEKGESLIFMIIGVAGLVTAIIFFFWVKGKFFTGAAIPLLVVGLLLAVVGYTVYKRSDGDRIRNVYAYDMNPGDLKDKELPRMRQVMKNFIIYRYTEIGLLLLGAALYFYFRRQGQQPLWQGFGLGLAVMAMLALLADFFAEQRGKKYLQGIESFISRNA